MQMRREACRVEGLEVSCWLREDSGRPSLLPRYTRMSSLCWKVCSVFGHMTSKLTPSTELGVNFGHIKTKSWTVLNPLKRPDQHIMDDADLAGPILFCFCFGMFLLLVRPRPHIHHDV